MSEKKQSWIWPLHPLKPRSWGNLQWEIDGSPPGQTLDIRRAEGRGVTAYLKAGETKPPGTIIAIQRFYIPTDCDLAVLRQYYPQDDPHCPAWLRIKSDLIDGGHDPAILVQSEPPTLLRLLAKRKVLTILEDWTLPRVIEAVKSIRDLAGELQILETSVIAKPRIRRITQIVPPDTTSEYGLAAAQHILTEDGRTALLEILSACGVLFEYSGMFSRSSFNAKHPFDSDGVKKAARDLTYVCDQWLKMMEPKAVAETSSPANSAKGTTAVQKAENDGEKDSTQSQLKEPSKDAIKAYRAHRIMGMRQTEVADELGVNQGQVSRWIQEVSTWIKAGNILPDLTSPARQVKPMDPSPIGLGKRQDGKSSQNPAALSARQKAQNQ